MRGRASGSPGGAAVNSRGCQPPDLRGVAPPLRPAPRGRPKLRPQLGSVAPPARRTNGPRASGSQGGEGGLATSLLVRRRRGLGYARGAGIARRGEAVGAAPARWPWGEERLATVALRRAMPALRAFSPFTVIGAGKDARRRPKLPPQLDFRRPFGAPRTDHPLASGSRGLTPPAIDYRPFGAKKTNLPNGLARLRRAGRPSDTELRRR